MYLLECLTTSLSLSLSHTHTHTHTHTQSILSALSVVPTFPSPSLPLTSLPPSLPLPPSLHSSSSSSSSILHTHTEAAPTDAEQRVHSQVSAVLVKAPEILEELRTYKGAGEQIREVS